MQQNHTADGLERLDPGSQDVIANVLRHLALTDGVSEPRFQRFTRLGCRLAEAPIALVSFVDESSYRQYFKSARGLPEGVTQTDLDRSFCKLVTRTGEMLSVVDARMDPRVKDNPIIHEMGVIAYLGAPIFGPLGEALGSLCVLDRVPRDWTENQRRALSDLADCVTDYIELRHVRLEKTKSRSSALA